MLSAEGGDRKRRDENGLPWSEIAFQAYTYRDPQAAAPADTPAKLSFVFQHSIVNDETKSIILELNGGEEITDFMPGEEGFYALLGCENGRRAGFLVKDHGNALHASTVSRICTFWTGDGWNMLIQLG